MRLRVLLALVAAVAVTAFAPVPFPKEKKATGVKDIEGLQGLWVVTARERAGGAKMKVLGGRQYVRIEGKSWSFGSDDGMGGFRQGLTCTMTLDSNKKPMWLDLTPAGGAIGVPKGGVAGGPYMVGLVEVTGDKMRFIYALRGERPTGFTPNAPREYLYVFERVKKP